MADDPTPAPDPAETPPRKATRKTALSADSPDLLGVPPVRYLGEPQVFMTLGGLLHPGDVIYPESQGLEDALLARGDFELADLPA